MIFDKITNIDKYLEIPAETADFIKKLTLDIPIGRHELSNDNYANVEEYFTRKHEDCRLEAHKNYIDIQLLLKGREELDYTDISRLDVDEEYDKNRDIMFFKTPNNRLNSCILEPGYFVMLYPHEAHQPQMNYSEDSTCVKKVVVKVFVSK